MINRNAILRKFFHFLFLLKRPMTLGVRIIVEDDEGRVLLVRHTYVSGWSLPGGGVEVGETQHQAVKKELREETGIEASSEPVLLGVYWNSDASKRDHVSLFKVENWLQAEVFKPNLEISEIEFFSVNALPVNTGRATRERLEEIYHSRPMSEHW